MYRLNVQNKLMVLILCYFFRALWSFAWSTLQFFMGCYCGGSGCGFYQLRDKWLYADKVEEIEASSTGLYMAVTNLTTIDERSVTYFAPVGRFYLLV